MDQEPEGTGVVIFVVCGVVLLVLLLGGAAFFLFPGWHEDSVRKEVEATSPLKDIHRAVKEYKPEPIFPDEAEKTPNPPPDGEANTLRSVPQPKAEKQELPKGPGEPPVPKK